jgi:hypothetical protein
MHFEATVFLERGDMDSLVSDLAAVQALLNERRAARVIRRAERIIQEAA